MESEKMIDLSPLWENFSGQAIIALSLFALVAIIVGIATQGFGRTMATVGGIIVLVMIILAFNYIREIGDWLMKLVFKLGPGAGAIYHGIQLH